MIGKKLYLDDTASTAVNKEVVKAMLPYFSENYGNPSSSHDFGESARAAVQEAREKLARTINCKPWEIVFTSGVTEANNLAFFGLARVANKVSKNKKIIVSAIEHASITEICNILQKQGYKIVRIPVNSQGLVDYGKIGREIDASTLLVSVMQVNNVFGTIQDLKTIGEMCASRNVPFHTDASQSFGKQSIDVKSMKLSMLSASAHKIGGPKGVGMLYVKDGLNLEPIIFGGGQERGLRGGTENVPGIVGFAKAAELALRTNRSIVEKNRDTLMSELQKIGGKVNGAFGKNRAYNNVHVSFPGADASNLVTYLSGKGVYVSTGSACESKRDKEDYVLQAIGLSDREVKGAIRITLNERISKEDIKRVILEIKKGLRINKQ